MNTGISSVDSQNNPLPSWEDLKTIIASMAEQMKEKDRWLQEQKAETDRQIRENNRILQEQRAETDRRIRENDRLLREQREEHKLRMKENERRIMESEQWKVAQEQWKKEHEQWRKENEKRMQESDRRFRELATRFTSQSGHIVEGLMEPSALRLFQASGFDICRCWKEMKGHKKSINRKMEIDLFYHDTTEAVAVEVKINCTRADVDHFLDQMSHFKEVFDNFAHLRVYVAIAAINFDREADKYAAEKGLFVIRVADYDIFSLDPAKKEDMRSF